MKIRYKNITSIFLLITGLVILVHLIIPHDHHYDNLSEETHNEHQEKNDKGQEPIHCHFFNDVVVNKAVVSYDNIVKQISILYAYVSELNFDFDHNTILNAIFYKDFYYPDFLAILSVSPTRGSPLSFL